MYPYRPPRFSSAMAKVYSSALLIFAIAFGSRLIWWLIQPFLWMILTIVALGAVYMVIFRGFRR
jgi:NADH:ubiquinone oxidoreductase subunit 6 (subunit J)